MHNKIAELNEELKVVEIGRQESEARNELLENLKQEKDKKESLIKKLKLHSDNDPVVIAKMVKETENAMQAANRWTDNIFSIQGWIKKKFPSIDQVTFGIF